MPVEGGTFEMFSNGFVTKYQLQPLFFRGGQEERSLGSSATARSGKIQVGAWIGDLRTCQK